MSSTLLKILPIGFQQSFELALNHYNWSWTTKMQPATYLLPFVFNDVPKGSLTVSEFKVRPITVKGNIKTVDTDGIETLNTGLIAWLRGDNKDTFYYRAKARVSLSLTTGLHEYYIKLSDDSEFISEPFLYIGDCEDSPSSTAGDFSISTTAPAGTVDDWNEDFYK